MNTIKRNIKPFKRKTNDEKRVKNCFVSLEKCDLSVKFLGSSNESDYLQLSSEKYKKIGFFDQFSEIKNSKKVKKIDIEEPSSTTPDEILTETFTNTFETSTLSSISSFSQQPPQSMDNSIVYITSTYKSDDSSPTLQLSSHLEFISNTTDSSQHQSSLHQTSQEHPQKEPQTTLQQPPTFPIQTEYPSFFSDTIFSIDLSNDVMLGSQLDLDNDLLVTFKTDDSSINHKDSFQSVDNDQDLGMDLVSEQDWTLSEYIQPVSDYTEHEHDKPPTSNIKSTTSILDYVSKMEKKKKLVKQFCQNLDVFKTGLRKKERKNSDMSEDAAKSDDCTQHKSELQNKTKIKSFNDKKKSDNVKNPMSKMERIPLKRKADDKRTEKERKIKNFDHDKKTNKLSQTEVCRGPGCKNKLQNSSSVYCSVVCLEGHVDQSLCLLSFPQSENSSEQDRVMVMDRKENKLLTGPLAPTPSGLLAWILKHPTFEVLLPKISSNKNDLLTKKKPIRKDDASVEIKDAEDILKTSHDNTNKRIQSDSIKGDIKLETSSTKAADSSYLSSHANTHDGFSNFSTQHKTSHHSPINSYHSSISLHRSHSNNHKFLTNTQQPSTNNHHSPTNTHHSPTNTHHSPINYHRMNARRCIYRALNQSLTDKHYKADLKTTSITYENELYKCCKKDLASTRHENNNNNNNNENNNNNLISSRYQQLLKHLIKTIDQSSFKAVYAGLKSSDFLAAVQNTFNNNNNTNDKRLNNIDNMNNKNNNSNDNSNFKSGESHSSHNNRNNYHNHHRRHHPIHHRRDSSHGGYYRDTNKYEISGNNNSNNNDSNSNINNKSSSSSNNNNKNNNEYVRDKNSRNWYKNRYKDRKYNRNDDHTKNSLDDLRRHPLTAYKQQEVPQSGGKTDVPGKNNDDKINNNNNNNNTDNKNNSNHEKNNINNNHNNEENHNKSMSNKKNPRQPSNMAPVWSGCVSISSSSSSTTSSSSSTTSSSSFSGLIAYHTSGNEQVLSNNIKEELKIEQLIEVSEVEQRVRTNIPSRKETSVMCISCYGDMDDSFKELLCLLREGVEKNEIINNCKEKSSLNNIITKERGDVIYNNLDNARENNKTSCKLYNTKDNLIEANSSHVNTVEKESIIKIRSNDNHTNYKKLKCARLDVTGLKGIDHMFLWPLNSTDPIPQTLIPFHGPGLDVNRGDVILVIVLHDSILPTTEEEEEEDEDDLEVPMNAEEQAIIKMIPKPGNIVEKNFKTPSKLYHKIKNTISSSSSSSSLILSSSSAQFSSSSSSFSFTALSSVSSSFNSVTKATSSNRTYKLQPPLSLDNNNNNDYVVSSHINHRDFKTETMNENTQKNHSNDDNIERTTPILSTTITTTVNTINNINNSNNNNNNNGNKFEYNKLEDLMKSEDFQKVVSQLSSINNALNNASNNKNDSYKSKNILNGDIKNNTIYNITSNHNNINYGNSCNNKNYSDHTAKLINANINTSNNNNNCPMEKGFNCNQSADVDTFKSDYNTANENNYQNKPIKNTAFELRSPLHHQQTSTLHDSTTYKNHHIYQPRGDNQRNCYQHRKMQHNLEERNNYHFHNGMSNGSYQEYNNNGYETLNISPPTPHLFRYHHPGSYYPPIHQPSSKDHFKTIDYNHRKTQDSSRRPYEDDGRSSDLDSSNDYYYGSAQYNNQHYNSQPYIARNHYNIPDRYNTQNYNKTQHYNNYSKKHHNNASINESPFQPYPPMKTFQQPYTPAQLNQSVYHGNQRPGNHQTYKQRYNQGYCSRPQNYQ